MALVIVTDAPLVAASRAAYVTAELSDSAAETRNLVNRNAIDPACKDSRI